MIKSIIITFSLVLILVSSNEPPSSSPTQGRNRDPAPTGIRLFFSRIARSIATSFKEFSKSTETFLLRIQDEWKQGWIAMFMKKGGISDGSALDGQQSLRKNPSDNQNDVSILIDGYYDTGSPPGSSSSEHQSLLLRPSDSYIDRDNLRNLIGDSSEYEPIDEFLLNGYETCAILEAMRQERFLKNVCMNCAEDVKEECWIVEGPWRRRLFCGKTRKEFMIQPKFRQTHRYGYLSKSCAVYLIDQQVQISAKMLSAILSIMVKIEIDQPPDSPIASLSVSLKISGSGSSLILMSAIPKAKDLARMDYLNVRPVVTVILENSEPSIMQEIKLEQSDSIEISSSVKLCSSDEEETKHCHEIDIPDPEQPAGISSIRLTRLMLALSYWLSFLLSILYRIWPTSILRAFSCKSLGDV